jgi:hypothetical protein
VQSGPGWASGTCLAVVAGSIPACPFFLYRVFPVLTGYEPLICHAFVQRGAHYRRHIISLSTSPSVEDLWCQHRFHIPYSITQRCPFAFNVQMDVWVSRSHPCTRQAHQCPFSRGGGPLPVWGVRIPYTHTCAHEWGVHLNRQYGGC